MHLFRIHGDNIVECERIADVIIKETRPTSCNVSLMSPSTMVFELSFSYANMEANWRLELLPGFNKAGRHRWEGNIFKALKDSGFEKPLLLSIESKERSSDLEPDVGTGLINYIRSLLSYVPNVERDVSPRVSGWRKATRMVSIGSYEVLSAAAYLKDSAQSNHF